MPTLRLEPKGLAIEVRKGTLLIDAIRSAGLPVARSCGDDLICALCGVRVLKGSVSREKPVERESKRRNRIDPELRLSCALRVQDDLVVSTDYWGFEG